MSNSICIIGFGRESTITHVTSYLERNAIAFVLLDFEQINIHSTLSFTYTADKLTVVLNGTIYEMSTFRSFYCRFFYRPTTDNGLNELFSKMVSALMTWLKATTALVVSRPGAGASNFSKLWHIMDLAKTGFTIVPAFITGDKNTAIARLQDPVSWISKGCSSYRTRVVTYSPQLFANLDLLAFCPSQFQQEVTGYNVRVHMVGIKAIALKITTSNIDYRYDAHENSYEAVIPPLSIVEKCVTFCQQENLPFAGFDFIVDKEGQWFILEVNPMPGFEFYDRRLNDRIVAALASLLYDAVALSVVKYPVNRAFIEPGRRTKFH